MGDNPQQHTEYRNKIDLIVIDGPENPYTTNAYLRLASFRFRDGETSAQVLWLSEVESNLN